MAWIFYPFVPTSNEILPPNSNTIHLRLIPRKKRPLQAIKVRFKKSHSGRARVRRRAAPFKRLYRKRARAPCHRYNLAAKRASDKALTFLANFRFADHTSKIVDPLRID